MAEYIERKIAIVDACNALELYPFQYAALENALNRTPASDVAPIRYGRWEWFEEWSQSTPGHPAECQDCGWRCSECKTALEDIVGGYWDDIDIEPMINYCPNCGAKMATRG